VGIFSRKKKEDRPNPPSSSREIHDSFKVFVREAKFVGIFFNLNFENLEPDQKVFSFLQENPSCVAFMVMYGEGLDLIQCGEGEPQVTRVPFSELLEIELLEDYESSSLYLDDPDSDHGSVHHLRTPRAAMGLVTKELNIVLIANREQIEFVTTYLFLNRHFSQEI
jgi:hypothetical protein